MKYPILDEPYATGLRQAVEYLIQQFGDNIIGIIVAGSVLRGEGDKYSDMDTFVILDTNYRRPKDLLAILREDNPELVALVNRYHMADMDMRFEIAGQIADLTIGVRGFFEWDSGKDYLD